MERTLLIVPYAGLANSTGWGHVQMRSSVECVYVQIFNDKIQTSDDISMRARVCVSCNCITLTALHGLTWHCSQSLSCTPPQDLEWKGLLAPQIPSCSVYDNSGSGDLTWCKEWVIVFWWWAGVRLLEHVCDVTSVTWFWCCWSCTLECNKLCLMSND
jgi:hypothetical protein